MQEGGECRCKQLWVTLGVKLVHFYAKREIIEAFHVSKSIISEPQWPQVQQEAPRLIRHVLFFVQSWLQPRTVCVTWRFKCYTHATTRADPYFNAIKNIQIKSIRFQWIQVRLWTSDFGLEHSYEELPRLELHAVLIHCSTIYTSGLCQQLEVSIPSDPPWAHRCDQRVSTLHSTTRPRVYISTPARSWLARSIKCWSVRLIELLQYFIFDSLQYKISSDVS